MAQSMFKKSHELNEGYADRPIAQETAADTRTTHGSHQVLDLTARPQDRTGGWPSILVAWSILGHPRSANTEK